MDAEALRPRIRSSTRDRSAHRLERRNRASGVRIRKSGERTIVPEPGYMSYLGGTLLSDGVIYTYALRPENDFLVDLDEIPPDVLKAARILYLNYPNNPTAAIAP